MASITKKKNAFHILLMFIWLFLLDLTWLEREEIIFPEISRVFCVCEVCGPNFVKNLEFKSNFRICLEKWSLSGTIISILKKLKKG